MTNTNESIPQTEAVKQFKRTGGILDGGEIARFRRIKREQAENDDKRNTPHRPTVDDL